jgi:hypothetical protein
MYKHLPRQRRLDEDAKKEREKKIAIKGKQKDGPRTYSENNWQNCNIKITTLSFLSRGYSSNFFCIKIISQMLIVFSTSKFVIVAQQ